MRKTLRNENTYWEVWKNVGMVSLISEHEAGLSVLYILFKQSLLQTWKNEHLGQNHTSTKIVSKSLALHFSKNIFAFKTMLDFELLLSEVQCLCFI